MSGTLTGGLKTANTNKLRYGKNYYKELGQKGGKAPYKGKKGFAANPERARIAGAAGGRANKKNEKPTKSNFITMVVNNIRHKFSGDPLPTGSIFSPNNTTDHSKYINDISRK